jgi:hypothetical protein
MLALLTALWLCKTPVYGGQATRGARQKVKAVIRGLIHFSEYLLHNLPIGKWVNDKVIAIVN